MDAISGFSVAVKTFLKLGYEKMYHGVNMASCIRLSSIQLPKLYYRLPLICEKLGIEEPEFYLQMNSNPNAFTFDDSQIYVVMTSGLVEYLDNDNALMCYE